MNTIIYTTVLVILFLITSIVFIEPRNGNANSVILGFCILFSIFWPIFLPLVIILVSLRYFVKTINYFKTPSKKRDKQCN